MEKSRLLDVDSYRVEELHFVPSTPEEDQDGGLLFLPEVDFSAFTHSAVQDKFAVSLSVSGKREGLKFSLRIIGYFTVAEPFLDGKLPSERVVNALTILYGVVRGYLGMCAAMFGASVTLSTVYFTDLVKAKIESAKDLVVEESETRLIEPAKTA